MPESTISLSTLCAIGATAALGAAVTHLLLRKGDPKDKKKHQRRRRSRREQESDSSGSSTDDGPETHRTPPPPKPRPHHHNHRRRPSGAQMTPRPPTALNEDQLYHGAQYGFSMEDARMHAEQLATVATARNPKDVLEDLQKGNARFWTGTATRPEINVFERRALIKQQFPAVAILGCSDSRVPVEIVFDQGLGDMFVIRVAGNYLDTSTAASLDYAILHLKVKVVVVMGHEGCGAIKAAMRPGKDIEKEPKELSNMLFKIKKNLDEDRLSWAVDHRARDREAVVTNVKSQVALLTEQPEVMEKVKAKELMIVGAFYEISSGIVDFFYEVSEADLPQTPQGDGIELPSRGISSRFLPGTHEVMEQDGTVHRDNDRKVES